jgi:hypothetical protein
LVFYLCRLHDYRIAKFFAILFFIYIGVPNAARSLAYIGGSF